MSDAMQYAYRALSQRALSERELRERLKKRDVAEPEAERVLARLRELGYLDDASLARALGEKRGVGPLRLRSELARRGVPREVADTVLTGRDGERDHAEAARLVEKHHAKWQRAKNPRASAYGFLARRGFGSDVIRQALGDLGKLEEDGA